MLSRRAIGRIAARQRLHITTSTSTTSIAGNYLRTSAPYSRLAAPQNQKPYYEAPRRANIQNTIRAFATSAVIMPGPSANNTQTNPGMSYTSGRNDSVWTALQPYEQWPKFSKLSEDVQTDVVVVGAGMAGISTAYELVMKGIKTVLIDAREVTSGETGRTSAHLSDYLGERWKELIKSMSPSFYVCGITMLMERVNGSPRCRGYQAHLRVPPIRHQTRRGSCTEARYRLRV